MEIQQTQNTCSKKLIHSENQFRIYGVVANWCHQFGLTEDKKGRANLSVDNKMLTSLQPEEVHLLVCPPKQNVADALTTLDNRAHELLRKFLRSKVYRSAWDPDITSSKKLKQQKNVKRSKTW